MSSNLVQALDEDAQGNLWIGTNAGLNRYQNGKISSSQLPVEVAHVPITAISDDREGNLWVGTAYDGLIRLHPGEFVSYTKENGLNSDETQTVMEDTPPGMACLATALSRWRKTEAGACGSL